MDFFGFFWNFLDFLDFLDFLEFFGFFWNFWRFFRKNMRVYEDFFELTTPRVNSSFGGIGVSILVFTTRKVTTPFPKTDAILSLDKVVKEDCFYDILLIERFYKENGLIDA